MSSYQKVIIEAPKSVGHTTEVLCIEILGESWRHHQVFHKAGGFESTLQPAIRLRFEQQICDATYRSGGTKSIHSPDASQRGRFWPRAGVQKVVVIVGRHAVKSVTLD